ncbi:DUF4129 domain-containing protein [Kistimonas asteriae]|uniref:DUF4129 domain-containing protein n=1 Tax=Kistimonas asteriae TaxID=517724 RepID=UPI001BAE498F|nr:DUF4129 domain-containing protein [Kistimonas asteriae]
MDLSQLSIRPRLRSRYEAMDLGFVLARQWWRSLFLAWLIPSGVVFLVASLLVGERQWLALLLIWWFKPLWDCAPLYIASRQLFGESVSVGSAIRAMPGMLRADGFAWLTWRRFSPGRSFVMPVTALERLTGKRRRQRIGVLDQREGGGSAWLTIACAHIEAIFSMGAAFFLMLFLPDSIGVEWYNTDGPLWWLVVTNVLGWLAMSVMAPFYTMAGFALYINRRIELEGWDIEIRFRAMAQRFSETKRAKGTVTLRSWVVLAASFITALCLVTLEPAWARSSANDASDPLHDIGQVESREVIQSVLAGDAFHQQETQRGWRLKAFADEASEEPSNSWIVDFIQWLQAWSAHQGQMQQGMALLLEVLLWTLLAIVIAYLLYFYRKHLGRLLAGIASGAETKRATPTLLAGMDVRPESLPDDVPASAQSLWQSGDHRAAMGLLYRASLSRLIHAFSVPLVAGHTEQECVDLVAAHPDITLHEYMRCLTSDWQRLAYGHQVIEPQQFEALCLQWREVFCRG